jgi:hypothetical protein
MAEIAQQLLIEHEEIKIPTIIMRNDIETYLYNFG